MPTHAQPVIVSYPEFVSPLKKSVYSVDALWNIANLKAKWPGWPQPIFDNTHPNIFPPALNFWYQHINMLAIWSVCSRDMFDLKILQSDWSSSFWPNITEKQANRFTAFTFG